MELYHGTTKESARSIIESQKFQINRENIDKARSMVCDLGYGIYTYGPDEEGLWSPKNNARKYAIKYRCNGNEQNCRVIKVNIPDNKDLSVLDLDSSENQKKISQILTNLRTRADKLYDNIRESGSKRRKNMDGIMLELALKRGQLPDTDIVEKQTFTDFYDQEISNFPNGNEVVIRNEKIIENITK